MTFAPDRIHIEQLDLTARLGIAEKERSTPQRITLNLVLEPLRPFHDLQDRIENTTDYAEVCRIVQLLVATRAWNLIETLAEEIAAELLDRFSLSAVQVELRKYVLPETAFVAVVLRRERETK